MAARLKCPDCGGPTKNRICIKLGGPILPAPCKTCTEKERIRTHEVIANLAMQCGKRGLPE